MMDTFLSKAKSRSDAGKREYAKPNTAGRTLSNLSAVSHYSGFDDDNDGFADATIVHAATKASGSSAGVTDENKQYDSDDGFDVTSVLSLKSKTIVSRSLTTEGEESESPLSDLEKRLMASQEAAKSKTRAWDKRMIPSQQAAKRSALGEQKRNAADPLQQLVNSKRPRIDASTSASIVLTDEQQMVMTLARQGRSVFFTGAAGTGKSQLLKMLVDTMRGIKQDKLAVTASTGLAAISIGGVTLHKWTSLGLALDSVEELITRAKRYRSTLAVWTRTETLIIDEISMIDAKYFDKLDKVAQALRRNSRPFGGMQLIMTGDFYQLPPVGKNGVLAKMCFEAECWARLFDKSQTILLTKVFRQEGDSSLIHMLGALRQNELTDDVVAEFRQLSRPVVYEDGIEPTALFSTRAEVARANDYKLRHLPGSIRVFNAIDSKTGGYSGQEAITEDERRVLDNLMAQRRVELKIGANVIMIHNLSAELVNGMRGRVLTFVSDLTTRDVLARYQYRFPQIIDCFNETVGHIPLSVDSWSAFVEKYSYECLEALGDISHAFRVRLAKKEMRVSLDPNTRLKPVVHFPEQELTQMIEEHSFEISPGNNSKIKLVRYQIPLITAWALSIHKAQGQTIDRLVVDLNQAFETGQVYVAISRATSTKSLQILGFDRRRVKVDQRVVSFYKNLSTYN